MTTTRFRALPVREAGELRVDRNERVIYGVSTAQAVEALGHGVALDDISLTQIVEHGNSKKTGVKSRFTHPGMSSDGMGKYLGRLKDFRQEGDKALADLHLSKLASKSPDGDLGEYVMDMAEEESDMFGMSVVIDMESVFVVDGVEFEERPKDYDGLPFARIKNLVACDVVDEPAANRDGLFSNALWASNQDAEQAFNQLDSVLSEWGVSPGKAYDVAIKYFNARGVDVNQSKGEDMADKKTEATNQPEVTAEQVAELTAQLEATQAQLAEKDAAAQAAQDALSAKSEAEAELSQRVGKLEKALDASNKRNAEMAAEARRKRYAELAADWYGETDNHVLLLEQLADISADGEDSPGFAFYVETQNALTAQLDTSQLFEELGSDKEPEAIATETFDSAVRALMAEEKISYSVASQRISEERPKLYNDYVMGKRG